MFGALGEFVTSPQFIIEENAALAVDARSEIGDDDFQVPTKPGGGYPNDGNSRPITPTNHAPTNQATTMPAFRPQPGDRY